MCMQWFCSFAVFNVVKAPLLLNTQFSCWSIHLVTNLKSPINNECTIEEVYNSKVAVSRAVKGRAENRKVYFHGKHFFHVITRNIEMFKNDFNSEQFQVLDTPTASKLQQISCQYQFPLREYGWGDVRREELQFSEVNIEKLNEKFMKIDAFFISFI